MLFCLLKLVAEGRPAGAGKGPPPTIEPAPNEVPIMAWLRALWLEDVRWCRRPLVDGIENPEPEIKSVAGVPSAPLTLAEVDDVLDTTEAFCAARRIDSSRVRRLTW